MMRVIKILCALLVAGGTLALPSHADTMFTLAFDPLSYTTGPNGVVELMATVKNTGTVPLGKLSGAKFSNAGIPDVTPAINLGSLLFTFGSDTGLLPGDSVSFEFIDVTFSNLAPGAYTPITQAQLTLIDNTGADFTAMTQTVPQITVSAVPEPATFALLGTGLLATLGAVRRKTVLRA